jgi:hypothetical protein
MHRLLFVSLGLASVTLGLAACGSGGGLPDPSGGADGGTSSTAGPEAGTSTLPSSSGLPPSEKLVNLTDAQRGQLCDWVVTKFSDYGTRVDCTSDLFTYPDQASCVADSPSSTSTPDCGATVAQMETCIKSLPQCATSDDFVLSLQCADLTTC